MTPKTTVNTTPAIPADILDGLKLAHRRVKFALEQFTKAEAEQESRFAELEKMEDAFDRDQAALDFTDLKAIASIQTRKAQLVGLQEKAGKTAPVSKQSIIDAIQYEFNNDFTGPLRLFLMAEAEKAIGAFFADKLKVRQIAEQADCFGAIRHYRDCVSSGRNLKDADEAARIFTSTLERLFAGENIFKMPGWATN